MNDRQTEDVSQGSENGTQPKKKLKILNFVAMTANLASFVMGPGILMYLLTSFTYYTYTVYSNPLRQEIREAILAGTYTPYTSTITFTFWDVEPLVISFCGFMIRQPLEWLENFSESPNTFFGENSTVIRQYKPSRWFSVWITSSLFAYYIFIYASKPENFPRLGKEGYQLFSLFAELFLSSVPPFFIFGTLCIIILQYYKKLIVHKEN